MLNILGNYIPDKKIVWLLGRVIKSFPPNTIEQLYDDRYIVVKSTVGLPLGNLTSQLFCNIYMNQFDQFVKHKLHSKYYIRYADDFVLLLDNRDWLVGLIPEISNFLEAHLKLSLHPDKIILKTLASGTDFLGWMHFPHHRVLRNTTRRRMFRRIHELPMNESLQSYLGLLSHGNTFGLKERLLNWHGLWRQQQTG